MDRVRLGRALGYGTRHAARTLAAVAEAAAAPGPAGGQRVGGPASKAAGTPAGLGADAAPASRSARLPNAQQVRGAGRAIWGPLATFSWALWLRVTGVFFGLIALAMASAAWRLRAVLLQGAAVRPGEAGHFWIFAAFAGMFGYFALSGFVRANRRERRGQ